MFAYYWPWVYQAHPANVTQGDANLAQLTLAAQFYKQGALTTPDPTHPDANLAQLGSPLQFQQEKGHKKRTKRAARW